MHVLFKHLGVDEIFTAKFIYLMFAYKLILVVNNFLFFFLEFLGDIFDVRNPFRGGTELGDEETAYFRVLECS